ncbi:MAG: hypothetical protein K6A94_06375 [Bacteroidales bacterium]|nr:hypothetical protein [Bacteroidales bacterium]
MVKVEGKEKDMSIVYDDETYVRWIYRPRYINDNGTFRTTFVSLRERGDYKEEGISGQILERAGHEQVIKCGLSFRRISYDGTPKEERFVGYASAKCGQIRAVADSPDDKVDVLLTPSSVPHHAEIRFFILGVSVKGNNQNAHFLRYKDKLRELLAKNCYYASEKELTT